MDLSAKPTRIGNLSCSIKSTAISETNGTSLTDTYEKPSFDSPKYCFNKCADSSENNDCNRNSKEIAQNGNLCGDTSIHPQVKLTVNNHLRRRMNRHNDLSSVREGNDASLAQEHDQLVHQNKSIELPPFRVITRSNSEPPAPCLCYNTGHPSRRKGYRLEGPAILSHGSLIEIGCCKFVFAITAFGEACLKPRPSFPAACRTSNEILT